MGKKGTPHWTTRKLDATGNPWPVEMSPYECKSGFTVGSEKLNGLKPGQCKVGVASSQETVAQRSPASQEDRARLRSTSKSPVYLSPESEGSVLIWALGHGERHPQGLTECYR